MVRVIAFFFKSSWRKIVLASFFSSLSAGLNILSIKYLSDIITRPDLDLFYHVLSIVVFVSLSTVITIVIGRNITQHFEEKIADYRKELSSRILFSDYENVEKKLDRLVPVLMFEVGTIGSFGAFIPDVMVACFQMIAVIPYLFFLSWELTSITVALFVVVGMINILTLSFFKKREALLSKSRFRLHYVLDKMEKGVKDLMMNYSHTNRFIENSIDPPSRESAGHSLKLFMARVKIDSAINIVTILSFAIILIIAVTSVDISQGGLIEYLTLLLFVRPAINRISGFVKQVKNVENALEQIEKFDVNIRESGEILTKDIVEANKSEIPLIRIKNLSFCYENSGFTIGPLSFDIFKNELVIIKGGNGSGKSTLFKLIVGLYESSKGSIEYSGQTLDREFLRAYRSNFSCYFTGSPVFDDLGYLEHEDIRSLASEKIEQLEIQNKTKLGEDLLIEETNLSHGQQGRLNLFRMLLEDKPIYFFDEWAANQDVHFKEKFYTEIIPGLKQQGKTVILISHDDKYYHIADRIISLRNGQIE